MTDAGSAKSLAGKVALVTGGARGIGAATCRHLADAGATVLVNYARSADAAKKLAADIVAAGGKAAAIAGDVGNGDAVKAMFAEIDGKHGGKLDIVVNNAGVYKTGSVLELSDADYDTSFDTNVRAVFLVCREAVKRMSKGGRIITISSVLGERAIGESMSVYAGTKFAATGMTRALAHDLAPLGITANVVQPGPIDTEMNPADPAKNPAAQYMVQAVPAKRYGQASEVAAVVTFLASPASAYVNGAVINVDGGMNA